MTTSNNMSNWSYCQAYCTNDANTQLAGLLYYRMPSDVNILRMYKARLQTENVQWGNAYICSGHCHKGYRDSKDDIPEILVPDIVLERVLSRYEEEQNNARKKALGETLEAIRRLKKFDLPFPKRKNPLLDLPSIRSQ